MSLSDRLEEIVRPIVEERNAFLIEVAVRGERGGKVAEVFIDADEGVTAQLCEGISRALSQRLDGTDLIHGRFYLVVSSPGIERPLKYPRQYAKNIGRNVSLKIRSGDAVERLKGTLLEAAGEEILLGLTPEDRRKVRFEDIIEARIEAVW